MARGLSWLLPVMTDCFGADRLTNNLIKTSDTLANFAFFRKHAAPEASVRQFRDSISNQQQNNVPLGQNGTPNAKYGNDNIENYAAGSIVDLPNNVELEQLQGLPAESYVAALDESLRKIAAHFHLPMGIFGNRDERGAYAAEMVSNSYLVRSIQAMQSTWINYDLELLEMCGFDCEDITISAPEVSVIDSDKLINEMNFLIQNQMMSKNSAAKAFDIDWEKEQDLIKSEEPTEGIVKDNKEEGNI